MQTHTHRGVSTKEASELIGLLSLSTSAADRAEHWPSLLTLLTRWASHATAAAKAPPPARPWEQHRQRQQQQQQTVTKADPNRQVQELLQTAVTVVHQALQDAALQASSDPGGAAGAALSQLFVPAVSFLTAAVTVSTGPMAQQHQQLVVAAACEAAAALAAAPAELLLSKGAKQQGLPAVVSSCKVLLLACKGSAGQSAWLMSCLLSALHGTIPRLIQHAVQQLQSRQVLQGQQHTPDAAAAAAHQATHSASSSSSSRGGYSSSHGVSTAAAATAAGGVAGTANQPAELNVGVWAQQQAHATAVSATQGLLSGLYGLGHDLGSSCCRALVAGASASRRSSTQEHAKADSGLQVLQVLVSVLQAACAEGCDELLLGLAASVAAGLCAGVLVSLPPPAHSHGGSLAGVQHAGEDFAAVADAAWATTAQGAADSTGHSNSGSRAQQPELYSIGTQQLLGEAASLLASLQSACSRCEGFALATPATAVPAAAAAAAAVGLGLLGQAYGRFMSTCAQLLPVLAHAQQQQQPLPQQVLCAPSLPGLLCSLQYLTGHCCSLSGVFYFASGCQDAAAANSWLAGQQQQHPPQEVGLLARWWAAAAAATSTTAATGQVHAPHQHLLQCLAALKASGEHLARSYATYYLAVPAAVAAHVDAAAVRQQLDRSFAMHLAILSEIWQACSSGRAGHSTAGSVSSPAALAVTADGAASSAAVASYTDTQAAVVALSLGDLAALQFCRVQLPAYVDLLRQLVTGLATSSSAADAFINLALPCYDRLIQGLPIMTSSASAAPAGLATSSSSSGSTTDQAALVSAVWMKDNVTAAELSFLLPLLPVAVNASSNAAAAAERVLALVLLMLPHPLSGVAQAAHAAFAGLLAIAAQQQQQEQEQEHKHEGKQVPLPACHGQQQQQQQELQDVLQKAVPMYLQRALAALPAYGSLDGFSASYYSLLKNLPAGSLLSLLAANRVANKALKLAAAAAAAISQPDLHASVHQQGQRTPTSSGSSGGGGGLPQQASKASDSVDASPQGVVDVAKQLFDLLVLSLQLGDYQVLPAVLQTVANCVLAAPVPAQQQWMAQLYAGCLAVGDYTRKPALMAWLDDLQRQLLLQHQQQPQRQHGRGTAVRVAEAAPDVSEEPAVSASL